jgi:hypothetical protein
VQSLAIKRIVVGLSGLIATACIQPVEPTPTSPDFSIVPIPASTTSSGFRNGEFFSLEISVRNTSSREIFVDTKNLFVEKLIDQKWRHAYGAMDVPFATNGSVGPSKSYVFILTVLTSDGGGPYKLLENMRGVYRVHVGLSFDARGPSLLDSASTYSGPFTVKLP